MATTRPCFLLKNESTDQTFGVNERIYRRLIGRPEWVDGGSTGLPADLAEDASAEDASDLPEDFPGRSHLVKDGRFTTLEAVRATSDEDLDSVSGLGPATIEDIRTYLDEA